MKHMTNDDLLEVIHYLQRFRDNCRAGENRKSEGIARRNKAWADNADRLIDLLVKEMEI